MYVCLVVMCMCSVSLTKKDFRDFLSLMAVLRILSCTVEPPSKPALSFVGRVFSFWRLYLYWYDMDYWVMPSNVLCREVYCTVLLLEHLLSWGLLYDYRHTILRNCIEYLWYNYALVNALLCAHNCTHIHTYVCLYVYVHVRTVYVCMCVLYLAMNCE